MDNYQNAFMGFPGITPEEMITIQQATAEMSDKQKQAFYMIYSSKRKSAQDVLIFALLGFVCVAGIHRFALGQIGMGILYFFTGGLCAIGTIVDVINHKQLANDYNKQMAYESFQIAKMQA